ncbi:hypothetical protein [Roseococcus pinisoli]|uniref:DUF3592 domain-containing protein n=1 Tax=Roseococcus pinisoli TaxID=2835040 RepID=A0ABS5QEG0_9PROT|nr:hypothetical protein [Roseococcus pinisoli]MBS7812082.1 hypothetical protein [Roseococcus pinisoli]
MSDPIARAFPVRPLRIKAPLHPWRAWLLALMCVVLFGGGMVAVSYKTLPVLLTDYQVRNTAVVLPKTRVERGVCRVRFFLLNDCDATLVVPQDRGPAFRREVNYTFFEPSAGSRQVIAMGDPARPELITTDLGLDHFINRVVTFAVLMGFLLLLCLGSLRIPLIAHRQRRTAAILSGQVLNPVPVVLERSQAGWKATATSDGRSDTWRLGAKAEPFVVDHRSGIALAVTGAAGGPLFPLDEKLSWLDLSDEERAAIWAARAEIQRSAQGSAA